MTDDLPGQAGPASDAELDRLLDGATTGSGSSVLGPLLDAAREPATASELTGLAAATAAFAGAATTSSAGAAAATAAESAAARHASGTGRAGRVLRRLAAATVATKFALATTAAVAIGGTIAVVEHERGPSHPPPPSPSRSAPVRSSTSTAGSSPSTPSETPTGPSSGTTATTGTPGPGDADTPSRSPEPTDTGTEGDRLIGLCHSWLALSPTSAVRAAPRYSVLVSRAGGRAQVDAFCLQLIGSVSAPRTP